MSFISGDNKSKNEGTMVILGSRKHRKIKILWGTRENAEIFQGNKGTGIPPWKGLTISSFSFFRNKTRPVKNIILYTKKKKKKKKKISN